jgi:Periplasmic copper-binding protein (NosD)
MAKMSRVSRGAMARVILLAMLTCAIAVSRAAAQDIQCGDTLGPGGVFTLQADLFCDNTDIGLTVLEETILDLGGHTVGGRQIAILLTGRGAVLQNGIANSSNVSLQVAGQGGHTVQGIDTAPDSLPAGILILSDHNRVEGSIGRSLVVGFLVQGHHNQLEQNTGIGQGAFDVEGDHNVLRQNLVPTSSRFGFRITGAHNQLRENEVHRTEQGISVQGTANVIMHNTATGNFIDLVDSHADCDDNGWAHNVFQTSRAGDTVNPACIQ